MGDIIMGDGYLFLSYTACNLVAVIWLVFSYRMIANGKQLILAKIKEKKRTHRL